MDIESSTATPTALPEAVRVSPRRSPSPSGPVSARPHTRSAERRGTRKPSSSSSSARFATPTESSRRRNSAIASSLTHPPPPHRYRAEDNVEGVAVVEEDHMRGEEIPFSFPSTSMHTQRGSTATASPLHSASSTPSRRRGSPRVASKPRSRYPLSPSQRRDVKRASVQDLIGIAGASLIGHQQDLARREDRGEVEAELLSPTGLVEAKPEEALRSRHRRSVVVVPERAMVQFDDALRANPSFGAAARGDSVEVVTDATDYAGGIYRELHHRTFHSKSEELTFLRRDYVSLRKTLMLLYDENARLNMCLREKTDEVDQLQARVEACEKYHKGAESAEGRDSTDGGSPAKKPASRSQSPAKPGRRAPSPAAAQPAVDADKDADTTSTSSSLWLHAAAQKAVRQLGATNKGRNAGASDLNTMQLITELRRNLARRDTRLDALRLESTDLTHARNVVEKQLAEAREELRAVTQDRNRLLSLQETNSRDKEDALAANAALQKEKEANGKRIAALENEVEKLRLLQGSSPSFEIKASAGTSVDASADVAAVVGSQPLFEQVLEYRRRWQDAESRLEAALASNAAPTSLWTTATPPTFDEGIDINVIKYQNDKLQRDLEELTWQARRDKQSQLGQLERLRQELETVSAERDTALHDRDALVRQLRQTSDHDAHAQVLKAQVDSLRQRLAELSGQLKERHSREKALELEVLKAQHENVRLESATAVAEETAQRAQQQASLLEEEVALLRSRLGSSEGKVHALQQMVAALQQRHGRRSAGGERARAAEEANLDAGDSAEGAEKKRTKPSFCGCGMNQTGGSSEHHGAAGSDDDVDVDALASDLKGYAALMELNAALTARLGHLEQSLVDAKQTVEVVRAEQQQQQQQKAEKGGGESAESDTPPSEPFINEEMVRQRIIVLTELEALRHDLQLSQRAQQTLLRQWQELRRRYDELQEDNFILAEGTSVIHDELILLLREKEARAAAATDACAEKRNSKMCLSSSGEQDISPSASSSPSSPLRTTGRSQGVQVGDGDDCTTMAVPPPLPAPHSSLQSASSRRVRHLRGTVEAARVRCDDDEREILLEEQARLAARVQTLRKRVRALESRLLEKDGALAEAQREIAEYEDALCLLDRETNVRELCGAVSGRGRRAEHIRVGASRRGRVRGALSSRLSASSLPVSPTLSPRYQSRRRHRCTSTVSPFSGEEELSLCLSWCSADEDDDGGSFQTSSWSRSPSASRRHHHNNHHARHRRDSARRRRPRSSSLRSSQSRSRSASRASPMGMELYAVNCNTHRDASGALRESWTAVPLTQAETPRTAPVSRRHEPKESKKDKHKTHKKSTRAMVRDAGRGDGAGDTTRPQSARSTTSTITTTTSVAAALLVPNWNATC